MEKLYMGIDSGSVSTKGVIIDNYNNIIASVYMHTEGNPIEASKKVIKKMKESVDLDNYRVVAIGTTGSARKLIGTMLDAQIIGNEINAQTVATTRLYPKVKTIFEIGGENSKLILIDDGKIIDYSLNTSCLSGTGAFLDALARRLNIKLGSINNLKTSNEELNIISRCMIMAESNIIQKIQEGCKKEDVLAGVCKGIARNYINNVTKGKKIQVPIVFNGGVSKNNIVVKELERIIGEKIIINKNSHLMGAIGVAIMARENKDERIFDFNIDNYKLETNVVNCNKCSNNCLLVKVYKNDNLIDYWGNKCKTEGNA